MPLVKPDMTNIWASGGAVVKPSDVKIQTGWTPEVPPHQWENWVQKRQDEYLAHINQRGIPAWDGLTNYEASGLSYVQGSDGGIYKSVAASGPAGVVQNPTTDVVGTYWTLAFTVPQATETVQGVVELATQSEVDAGMVGNLVVTPDKLLGAFPQSLSQVGYQKTPGGLIDQWGTVTLNTIGTFHPQTLGSITWYTQSFIVNLPVAYTTSHFEVVATLAGRTHGAQGPANIAIVQTNKTTTGPGESLTSFTLTITTPATGWVPTIHFQSKGK